MCFRLFFFLSLLLASCHGNREDGCYHRGYGEYGGLGYRNNEDYGGSYVNYGGGMTIDINVRSCADLCGQERGYMFQKRGCNAFLDCSCDEYCGFQKYYCCSDFNATCPEQWNLFLNLSVTPLEELCGPDPPRPKLHFLCTSCQNRCGTRPWGRSSLSAGYPCGCDELCGFHGDCCHDFQEFCSQEFSSFKNLSNTPTNELCNPTNDFPTELHFLCNSCENRCGTSEYTSRFGYPCSCDEYCITSCCEDFQEFCPEIYNLRLEPLCEPDATIPDDLIQCGTCENRCGNTTNPEDLNIPGQQNLCSCDVYCGFHGDCCHDFQKYCAEDYDTFLDISALYPLVHNSSDLECVKFSTGQKTAAYNLMITTCSNGSSCEFTPELSEDVNTFVPMYDIHRGVHYISGQCALCNGAADIIPWGVQLDCSPVAEPRGYIGTGLVNSTDTFQDVSQNLTCVVDYEIVGVPRLCAMFVKSTCDPSCRNEKLRTLCESEPQALTIVGARRLLSRVARNVYCALCNSKRGETFDSLVCGYPGTYHHPWPKQCRYGCVSACCDGGGGDYPRPLGSFSLTMVFDFDPRKGLTVGKHHPECSSGEIYIPDEDSCRPITCPSGFVLHGSDCISEPSSAKVTFTGTSEDEPSLVEMDNPEPNEINLENRAQQNVENNMNEFNASHDQVTTEINEQSDSVSREVSTVTSALNGNHDNESKLEAFTHSFVEQETTEVDLTEVEKNSVESIQNSATSELDRTKSASKETHHNCTWVVYQKNETELGNDSVTVVSTGRTYDSGEFQIMERTVILCESFSEETLEELNEMDYVLSLVTLCGAGLSIICLTIRILLQFCLSSLRDKPGKLQLQLTIAYLAAFIMLIAGPFASHKPKACTTAAVLLDYFLLAVFIWMSVIAVHTWWAFRPSAAFLRADEDERSLAVHYILGWGIPLVLALDSLVMNYVDVDPRFKPDFGGFRCWYTQRLAMCVYFGAPTAISLLLNMIMFLLTSINLHKALNTSAQRSQSKSDHFAIYTRLFILMGITWIFGFISAFTDQIVTHLIFVTLTSLQGFFLFVSFVFNKRVWAEIKRKVKCRRSSFKDVTRSFMLRVSMETRNRNETTVVSNV